MRVLQLAKHIETGHPGHVDVEEEDVRVDLPDPLDGARTVARCRDMEALDAQAAGDQAGGGGFVISDQDHRPTVHHCHRSWDAWGCGFRNERNVAPGPPVAREPRIECRRRRVTVAPPTTVIRLA